MNPSLSAYEHLLDLPEPKSLKHRKFGPEDQMEMEFHLANDSLTPPDVKTTLNKKGDSDDNGLIPAVHTHK